MSIRQNFVMTGSFAAMILLELNTTLSNMAI